MNCLTLTILPNSEMERASRYVRRGCPCSYRRRGMAWVQCTVALDPLGCCYVYKNCTKLRGSISTDPVLLCTRPKPYPRRRCSHLEEDHVHLFERRKKTHKTKTNRTRERNHYLQTLITKCLTFFLCVYLGIKNYMHRMSHN
jgi:hypothetical protein